MDRSKPIFFIGNALVDSVTSCNEAFLNGHGLQKGMMILADLTHAEAIYAAMGSGLETSGGSAANTAFALASLGGNASFMGIVGDDQLGAIFRHDLAAAGVDTGAVGVTKTCATGRSLVLVTPDSQRTMVTSLGASAALSAAYVHDHHVAHAQCVYLEGYLLDHPQAWEVFQRVASCAKRYNVAVALTLSDPLCVARHHGRFAEFVRTSVSLLFANEHEIQALYQTSTLDDAIRAVRGDVVTAAITRSAQGAVLLDGDILCQIPADIVPRVIDTTGAGDFFAAGFLSGYAHGLPLEQCGRRAVRAASAVIQVAGARPSLIDWPAWVLAE